jgi:aryl-alcohol dehydrogenase-like predicted oxidoreductase
VDAVGVSNYGPRQLDRIYRYLTTRGVPLASAQVQYSLLSRGPEQEEIREACDALGMALVAYSPLGLGEAVCNCLLKEIVPFVRVCVCVCVDRGFMEKGGGRGFPRRGIEKQSKAKNRRCGVPDLQSNFVFAGMLTGKYSSSNPGTLPKGPRGLVFRQILPGLGPLLGTLEAVAKERKKTVSQVAINWCTVKGGVPIPGAKDLAQVRDNLGSLGWRLSDAEVAELEAAADRAPRGMVQNVFQTR